MPKHNVRTVSLIAAATLSLAGACGGRKNPDIQPVAPQPEPMAPGDPEPMQRGPTEPGGGTMAPSQMRDAGLPPEPIAPAPGSPGAPVLPTPGEDDKPPVPNPIP